VEQVNLAEDIESIAGFCKGGNFFCWATVFPQEIAQWN
jgi:hypothetical protein